MSPKLSISLLCGISAVGWKLLDSITSGFFSAGSVTVTFGGSDLVLKFLPANTRPATAMSDIGSAILTSC